MAPATGTAATTTTTATARNTISARSETRISGLGFQGRTRHTRVGKGGRIDTWTASLHASVLPVISVAVPKAIRHEPAERQGQSVSYPLSRLQIHVLPAFRRSRGLSWPPCCPT